MGSTSGGSWQNSGDWNSTWNTSSTQWSEGGSEEKKADVPNQASRGKALESFSDGRRFRPMAHEVGEPNHTEGGKPDTTDEKKAHRRQPSVPRSKSSADKAKPEADALQTEKKTKELEARLIEVESKLSAVERQVEDAKKTGDQSACAPMWNSSGVWCAPGPTVPPGPSLFSGRIVSLFPRYAIVECPEAATLYGNGSITVPNELLSLHAEVGTTLCFDLTSNPDGSPRIDPTGIFPVSEAGASFVGTIKAVSPKKEGKIGWVSSLATQEIYRSDVYVHGSMLDGLNVGNVISFSIHVNAKNQPQVSTGSLNRLDSNALTAGLNAVSNPPGRTMPLP